MKTRAYIVYKLFDFTNNKPTIGGVQTYLTDLICVLRGLQIPSVVCQIGENNLSVQTSDFEARQYKVSAISEMVKKIGQEANLEKDILIYGSDTLIVPKDGFRHSVAIQHGISWDIPSSKQFNLARYIGATALQTYRTIKRISNVKEVVCVDYNFQNWYRTQVDHDRTHLTVIPNYTRIAPVLNKSDDAVNIIFARRFYPYRGTRVFAGAVKRIAEEYACVNVTIAGSGPDEEWMRNKLAGLDRITFTQYESSESMKIHSDKHIAVVPTVGSEGTSLSLLEAMSSQCAVVASDVGGITNILIDGFNGLIVRAGDEEQLYQSIKYLLDNPIERNRLSKAGYATVKNGFSYEKWKDSWERVIIRMIDK